MLQGSCRDCASGLLLDTLRKLPHLTLPILLRPLVLHVRDIHDVHGFLRAKEFVGLLLAVTGVLPDHKVGRLDVGADMAELESGEALDQRAGVARQAPLDLFGHPVSARAESDRDAIGSKHDLLRHIESEGADNLLPSSVR
jgi:hypothetical protein